MPDMTLTTMPYTETSPGAIMSPAQMAALREEILASLRPGFAGSGQALTSLSPFLTGAPGGSPATDAAIEAFKIKTLPVIRNQMTLSGLGHSPAVAQVAGDTLAQALPQFITADMTNRLNAARLASDIGTGTTSQAQGINRSDADLGLAGVRLASDIANTEGMRQIEAARTAGQLQLGAGDLAARAAQLQQEQQRLALQAGQGAGGLQRDIAQSVSDSVQAERLRLQGLSEQGSFGVFGGLPSQALQKSSTKQSSSK